MWLVEYTETRIIEIINASCADDAIWQAKHLSESNFKEVATWWSAKRAEVSPKDDREDGNG